MYIPMFFIIAGFIAYLAYSTYRNNKIKRLLDDLIRGYDQVTLHLISYCVHSCGNDKKKQKEVAKSCAKAIVEAAGDTVTTKSLMGTTDILALSRVFQRDFKIRNKLTRPNYEFSTEYDKELKIIQETATDDINHWFGVKD